MKNPNKYRKKYLDKFYKKVEPVSVPISLEGKNVNMALNEIAMCNG